MLQKSPLCVDQTLLKVELRGHPFSSLLASWWQTTLITHHNHSCLHLCKKLCTLHPQIVLLSELVSLCLPSRHKSPARVASNRPVMSCHLLVPLTSAAFPAWISVISLIFFVLNHIHTFWSGKQYREEMSTSKLEVVVVVVASGVIEQIHLIITRNTLSSANLQSLPWAICSAHVLPLRTATIVPALNFPSNASLAYKISRNFYAITSNSSYF